MPLFPCQPGCGWPYPWFVVLGLFEFALLELEPELELELERVLELELELEPELEVFFDFDLAPSEKCRGSKKRAKQITVTELGFIFTLQ